MNSFEHEYGDILYHFIRNAKVKTVLELGVCTGISTRAMLKALEKGGRMWSIEIRQWEPHMTEIKSQFPLWNLIIADDLEVEWNREVDLIFIDTSHRYDQTLSELDKFSSFARHWIFLHDTKSNPQVSDAIKAFLMTDDHWIFGEWSHHHGLAVLMRYKRDDYDSISDPDERA